jgi:hypothetical protein
MTKIDVKPIKGPASICPLRDEADRKRVVLRAFVARMHSKRADDLVGLEADPAALRSIKAIGGRRVSGVRFSRRPVNIAD